jgi:hypothetical protein
MKLEQVLALLTAEATRIEQIAPGTVWHLFGSMLHSPDSAFDIDVAVLCPSSEVAGIVRREAGALCQRLPIHLFLWTKEEEAELSFVTNDGCWQFFPR